jgi:glycine hydroxymethyltransferase
MDQIAELISTVLTGTQPGTSAGGRPSKAGYVLDAAIAAKVAAQAADLLTAHPLYPDGTLPEGRTGSVKISVSRGVSRK